MLIERHAAVNVNDREKRCRWSTVVMINSKSNISQVLMK